MVFLRHLPSSKKPSASRRRTSSFTIVKFIFEAQVRIRMQSKNPIVFGNWMRQELIRLGPAFIKFGQFVSTRPDLLDSSIVKELSKLQDSITETPFSEIQTILENAYGPPNSEKWPFREVETKSIASASIGQVHRARLKGSESRIVLKIQKPFVAEAIREDLATLKDLNRMVFSLLRPMRMKEFDSILEQYEHFLSSELDYILETKNMKSFHEAYKTTPSVCIPRPVSRLCHANILAMEDIPSIKITNLDQLDELGVDRSQLATSLVSIFLMQIVEFGSIHCDPHPGNIGITSDKRIVLYDFGNVIRLSDMFRSKIKNLVFAVYLKDVDEFVDLLIELNIIRVSDSGKTSIDLLEIKAFFRYFFGYLETLNLNTLKTSIQSNEWISEMSDINVKLDNNFMALVRVFSLLDGTCATLDPEFSYIEALAPYTRNVFQDPRFLETRARRDFDKLLNYPAMVKSTDQNIVRLTQRMRSMSRDVNFTWIMMLTLYVFENVPKDSESNVLSLWVIPIIGMWLWSRRRDVNQKND